MVYRLLSEWCVVTSFYQSSANHVSFLPFSICATYYTLSGRHVTTIICKGNGRNWAGGPQATASPIQPGCQMGDASLSSIFYKNFCCFLIVSLPGARPPCSGYPQRSDRVQAAGANISWRGWASTPQRRWWARQAQLPARWGCSPPDAGG